MGRNRFVVPNVVRLPLSEGDWIEVKQELSEGERRRVAVSYLGRQHADGSRTPNMESLGMVGVLEYLVDWSLKDANDKPVKISLDALKSLRSEDWAEIDAAINAHIEATEEAAEARKKARGETAA